MTNEKKYILADTQEMDNREEMTLDQAKSWLIDFWMWNDQDDEVMSESEFEEFKADVRKAKNNSELNEFLAGIGYLLFEDHDEANEFAA